MAQYKTLFLFALFVVMISSIAATAPSFLRLKANDACPSGSYPCDVPGGCCPPGQWCYRTRTEQQFCANPSIY